MLRMKVGGKKMEFQDEVKRAFASINKDMKALKLFVEKVGKKLDILAEEIDLMKKNSAEQTLEESKGLYDA